MSTYALMLTYITDDLEGRDVVTFDIPWAFTSFWNVKNHKHVNIWSNSRTFHKGISRSILKIRCRGIREEIIVWGYEESNIWNTEGSTVILGEPFKLISLYLHLITNGNEKLPKFRIYYGTFTKRRIKKSMEVFTRLLSSRTTLT